MVKLWKNYRSQSSAQTINKLRYFFYFYRNFVFFLLAFAVMTGLFYLLPGSNANNWNLIRKDIIKIIRSNSKYDDGSYGPIFIRLAWHSAGTFISQSNKWGSNGATMRFKPESGYGANAGLQIARDLLNDIKEKYPKISTADLWVLAGIVAIEEMGGPKIPFQSGRVDKLESDEGPPDGLLPDAKQGADHIRGIFSRMGFSDMDIVALSGAHVVGRCHSDRSGFIGPWTPSPTKFSNDYYVQLTMKNWTKKDWKGPLQYTDQSGTLTMLPTDLSLLDDARFEKYVRVYASNPSIFFIDFANAFQKLVNNGLSVTQ